ncbi:MAG: hypothetical protein LBU70_01455, partial [Chitinispirillales bacterium]|nr:hypothetical protein [Chitinispirillales bacterium]
MNFSKMIFSARPVIAAVTIAAFIVLFAVARAAYATPVENCVSFVSPLTGAVLSAPSCTISIEVECPNITRVDIMVRHALMDGDSAAATHLVSFTRPPYKYFWNISELPNRLFTGISIEAMAAVSGGEPRLAARQEGIFLA